MTLALTSLEVAALVRDIALITFFVIGSIAMLTAFFLGLSFYRKTKRLVERAEAGVDRIEAMVETVDSTAASVRKTATYVNRGMRTRDFAMSAVNTVLRRGDKGDGRG